jgi:signal transduction histidine kinase/ligand-binding sensor domain-containing protein
MSACRSFHVFVCVCAFLGSIECTAAGLATEQGISQYSLTQWGHRDGLPSTAIYAIVQTPDGFLWLGTADGLIRFDGIRFFQVPLLGKGDTAFGRVRALAASADGALWVGTENGMLVRIDGQAMKSLTLNLPISSIRERADSLIEVETSNEVFRVSPATMQITTTCQVRSASALDSEPHPSQSMSLGKVDSAECGLQSAHNVAPSILARAHLTSDQIRSILPDNDGNLWLATRESGVIRVSTTAGEAHAGNEQFSVVDGLSSNSVWTLFEDREHNLWIGTQNGLNRLHYDKFATMTRRSGLLSDNITSLAVVGNEVFAGSAVGLNEISAAGAKSLLRGSILSLTGGIDGALFAGTPQGLSIVKDGRSQVVQPGVQVTQITSIAQSSTGELWFYDQQRGLFRWEPGHIAIAVTTPAMQHKAVSVITAGARGEVWFGLSTGEIVLYDGVTFHQFTAADHLPGGSPHAISADSDGSAWIASERGLTRYSEGRFTSWSRKNGLPGSRVLWAVPGPGGRLWLGYNIGVASVAISDLLRAATDPKFLVPYDFYDDGDGLHNNPDLHGSTPVAVLPGGRIWLTASEGLATIDPAHIRKNPVPPPVHIVLITVDDANVEVARAITLPPLTRRIEINYTGLSFTNPRKVTFRYRLLGFDSQWNAESTRRIATYTNLPPGKYRFEVLAANDDGVWNTEPAVLDFTLLPTFYQTNWFIALCLLTLLLVILLLVRFRIRSVADGLRRRFEERLDERARVAQDLHDNLLQDVMGISLQLEIADELTPPGAAGKPILSRALQLSESALVQGRGALTTLRATIISAQDVLQALKLTATHFPEDRYRAIRYITEGTELPLRAGVGDEIIQIACEALRNALKHTRGRVEVRLSYTPNVFTLHVEDEGPGISQPILESGAPGHFGLVGMRERASRIAATLTIESKRDDGTRIRLVVPGRMAYPDHKASPSIWSRLQARWSGTRRQP